MTRTWQKISFFGVLYFVQGAAFAYAVNFQKPYLTTQGLDKTTVGLFTALLLLPFICKIFFGMLSDRVPLGRLGPRKPYMLIGLGLFASCYMILSWVKPGDHFVQFLILSFVASMGLALFDTCCDGWAIDVSRADEQSFLQAAMVAGRSLGLAAASVVFGFTADVFGYERIFQVLALMAAGVWIVVAALPYLPLGGGQLQQAERPNWTEFKNLLSPGYLLFALYGVFYSISSFGTDGLMTLHLADVHLVNAFDLGLFGTCRGIGALTGAWLFAKYSRNMTMLRLVRGALLTLGTGCLMPLLGVPFNILGGFWGLAWGLQETAFVTLAMGFARGPWAATYFAVFMIYSNVGTAIGEALGGSMVDKFGYDFVFVGFAALAWLMALTMPRALLRNL